MNAMLISIQLIIEMSIFPLFSFLLPSKMKVLDSTSSIFFIQLSSSVHVLHLHIFLESLKKNVAADVYFEQLVIWGFFKYWFYQTMTCYPLTGKVQ